MDFNGSYLCDVLNEDFRKKPYKVQYDTLQKQHPKGEYWDCKVGDVHGECLCENLSIAHDTIEMDA